MFGGSRASSMRGQAPLCPHRRPPRPQHLIFSVFRRGGLHFGHDTTSNRDLTAPEGSLHDQYGGHRKICWARLWNTWAAVPMGGAEPGRTSHSDTSDAGMEGAGGHGGPGCGAHGRGEAWPGFETTHPATHSDTSAAGVEGPEGQAAVPVGGGRAWPGFETTHQSASATGHHWVERPDTQAAVPIR